MTSFSLSSPLPSSFPCFYGFSARRGIAIESYLAVIVSDTQLNPATTDIKAQVFYLFPLLSVPLYRAITVHQRRMVIVHIVRHHNQKSNQCPRKLIILLQNIVQIEYLVSLFFLVFFFLVYCVTSGTISLTQIGK